MSSIKHLQRWWRGAGVRAARRRVDVILSTAEMWRLLQRERLRSDRNGIPFSLIALQVVDDDATPLLRVLRRRLRSTDVAGHLQHRLLGVFLPDTPEEGARQVLEEILSALPHDYAEPQVDIFVHPEPSHLQAQPTTSRDNRPPDNPQPANRLADHLPSSRKETARLQQRSGDLPSRPLNWLFAQPLPWWKRTLDVVGASVGLVLLSPVLILTAVAIRCTSSGPIFFLQQREGRGGETFTIWKFRTMVVNAESLQAQLPNETDGPAFKMKHDPRVTSVGRFLRNTCIDELPQLINVLRGEMSLVGPRPLVIRESRACESWQRRRLDVTPGLTCFWQASPRRSEIPFQQWMRMDLRYARRPSLLRDLLLIVQTATKVVLRWRTG
jgi:lipopolysaccharide/colanic/teichoic acid biosynthesis glycosyltransferase